MEAKIIDRGVDEVLKVGDKITRIDHLSTRQFIDVLKSHKLVPDVEFITFDEYEASNSSKDISCVKEDRED